MPSKCRAEYRALPFSFVHIWRNCQENLRCRASCGQKKKKTNKNTQQSLFTSYFCPHYNAGTTTLRCITNARTDLKRNKKSMKAWNNVEKHRVRILAPSHPSRVRINSPSSSRPFFQRPIHPISLHKTKQNKEEKKLWQRRTLLI